MLLSILILAVLGGQAERPMPVEFTYHDSLSAQEQASLKDSLPEYLSDTQGMIVYSHIGRHLDTRGSGFELCRPAKWSFHADSVDIQVGYMDSHCVITG